MVANKGKEESGFSLCEMCGGAWLDGEEPAGPHRRPFLISKATLQREGAQWECTGGVRRGVFLGHEFRTDVLLLRIPIRDPIDFSPTQPWLYDALASLSEALALGASLHLDIDPGELSAGFRLLPGLAGEKGAAELYLYDTAAGGAGYAADAGTDLDAVLARTETVLRDCIANCERSCTKCLRHYGNRFLHSRLDRHLALSLLQYARSGDAPAVLSPKNQAKLVGPLAKLLTLGGWRLVGDARATPLKMVNEAKESVSVFVYPALLAPEAAEKFQAVLGDPASRTVLLPDYLLQRDLPSAYQRVVEVPKNAGPTGPTGGVVPRDTRPRVTLPVRELRTLATGREPAGVVSLPTGPIPEGAFAVRMPSGALAKLGYGAGSWLVLRPFSRQDLDGKQHIVVLRPRGKFKATGDSWTVARVRPLGDGDGRLQVTYARGEAEFRPERPDTKEVLLVATVLAGIKAEDG